MDGGGRKVALKDQHNVDGGRFEDVNTQMRDMEIEDRKKHDGEEHMADEENAVGVVAHFREGGGTKDKEGGDSREAENNIAVTDAFGEQALLNVKIQIERSVQGEKGDEDPA